MGEWVGGFWLWAHSLASIRGLVVECLSVLTAPCWVVGYIALRLGNTRREKMISSPVILKFLSSFQVGPLAIYFSIFYFLKYLPPAFVLSRFSSCISWERQGQVCLLHLTQRQSPPPFLPNLSSAPPVDLQDMVRELLWWKDGRLCFHQGAVRTPVSWGSPCQGTALDVFLSLVFGHHDLAGTESGQNCFVKYFHTVWRYILHFTFRPGKSPYFLHLCSHCRVIMLCYHTILGLPKGPAKTPTRIIHTRV